MIGRGTLTAYAGQTVLLQGRGDLAPSNVDVFLAGRGAMVVKAAQSARAILAGRGEIFANATLGTAGFAELPGMASIGGDVEDYGIGRAELPAMFAYGQGGEYEPDQPVTGYGTLPVVVSSGIMLTIALMQGDTELPAMQSLGGEGHYGAGAVALPALASKGIEGEDRLNATFFSFMMGGSPAETQHDMVAIFTSTGTLVDSFSGDRMLVQELIVDLEATGYFSLQAVMLQEMIDEALAHSILAGQTEGRPSLSGRAWVVNMETSASGQYDGYGFNSFFVRDGVTYGVAEDGIYKLEGDTDAGTPIKALLETGRSSFGDHKPKKLLNVYLGVGADKALYLKVETDGVSKVYKMENNGSAMRTQRVRVPHTMIGSHWNFILMNDQGGGFDLSSIEFTPVPLARRI